MYVVFRGTDSDESFVSGGEKAVYEGALENPQAIDWDRKSDLGDFSTNYRLGVTGTVQRSHLDDALALTRAAEAYAASLNPPLKVTVVGQSLGGGLAGLVSAIENLAGIAIAPAGFSAQLEVESMLQAFEELGITRAEIRNWEDYNSITVETSLRERFRISDILTENGAEERVANIDALIARADSILNDFKTRHLSNLEIHTITGEMLSDGLPGYVGMLSPSEQYTAPKTSYDIGEFPSVIGGTITNTPISIHGAALHALVIRTHGYGDASFANLLKSNADLRYGLFENTMISGPRAGNRDDPRSVEYGGSGLNSEGDGASQILFRALWYTAAEEGGFYDSFHGNFGKYLSGGRFDDSSNPNGSLHRAFTFLGLQVVRDALNRTGDGYVVSDAGMHPFTLDGLTNGVGVDTVNLRRPTGDTSNDLSYIFGRADLNGLFKADAYQSSVPFHSELTSAIDRLNFWTVAVSQHGTDPLMYEMDENGKASDRQVRDGGHMVLGGSTSDRIRTSSSVDFVSAGAGDDIVEGGAGGDFLIGGDNSSYGDTVSYSQSSEGVVINLSVLSPMHGGDAEGDVIIGFENVIGSKHADTFIATGNSGETYDGGDDADIIDLSSLANRGTRAVGSEQFHYVTALGSSTVNGSVLGGTTTSFTIKFIEDVKGSNFTDRIGGNDEVNKLWGNAGNDILFGFDGDDFLYGGLNDDRLVGGKGADYLDGGDGTKNRAIYFWDATTGVEVNLITGTGKGGDAEGDILVNIQEVDGTNYKDVIHLGNSTWGYTWTYDGDDEIYGGTTKNGVFDNLIHTREGSDRFYYQAGKATYYGGTDTTGGIDTVDLSLVNDGYKFKLRVSNALITRNDNQHYQQIIAYETEQFVGSKGNDTFEIVNALYTSGNTYDGSDGFNILDMSTEGHVNAYSFNFNLSSGVVQWDNSQNGFTIKNMDKIFATRFNDTFWGGTEEVWIEGGVGDDYLYAGSGIEHFNGGDSAQKSYPLKDTINYQNSTGRVIIDLNSTTTQQGGWAQGDILIDVENIVGSNVQGEGDILTNRNIFNTYINGLAGDDEIFLFGANSSANGGSGNDEIHLMGLSQDIYGGTGVDMFYINSNSKSGQIYDYELGEKIVIEGYNQSQIEIRPSYSSHVKGLWIDGQHFFGVQSATATLKFGYDDLLFV